MSGNSSTIIDTNYLQMFRPFPKSISYNKIEEVFIQKMISLKYCIYKDKEILYITLIPDQFIPF